MKKVLLILLLSFICTIGYSQDHFVIGSGEVITVPNGDGVSTTYQKKWVVITKGAYIYFHVDGWDVEKFLVSSIEENTRDDGGKYTFLIADTSGTDYSSIGITIDNDSVIVFTTDHNDKMSIWIFKM